jgi:hypothetical protein
MKGMLIPLRSNELLCSPAADTSRFHFAVDLRLASMQLPLFERSGITPELSGRAHNTDLFQVLDTRPANSRSG